MALQFTEVAKKAIETVKKGLEKTIEKLEEGKGLGESFKEGVKEVKGSIFEELNKIISPEKVESLQNNQEKLNALQDTIEQNPTEVAENKENFVQELSNVEKDVVETTNEINEKIEADKELLFPEIKDALNEIKDLLDQIKEIKDKLSEMGIDTNSALSEMLQSNGSGEEVSEDEAGESE